MDSVDDHGDPKDQLVGPRGEAAMDSNGDHGDTKQEYQEEANGGASNDVHHEGKRHREEPYHGEIATQACCRE